ncbi:universal stress protein [Pseudonocardia acidicola]|uniref:Universal stress protein n=1 Tax=Pseudonocardia acidicola TaxID=2724939 RepID=A0ABX1SH11_9PSEU|nr:universal stress protein [Pseudonocardia acidicola]NMH99768.1 universal stress protein [Pseudonocardia acidicola]
MSDAFELGCDGPATVVVGVDGSDTGWRALYYAVGQARRQGSRVLAVYAERLPAASFAVAGTVAIPTLDEAADAQFRASLRTTVEELGREQGVDAQFVLAEGDPVLALTRVAEQVHADAIVVGASMQAGHRLFGSVAVRAVRAGGRPVTVVP